MDYCDRRAGAAFSWQAAACPCFRQLRSMGSQAGDAHHLLASAVRLVVFIRWRNPAASTYLSACTYVIKHADHGRVGLLQTASAGSRTPAIADRFSGIVRQPEAGASPASAVAKVGVPGTTRRRRRS